MTLLDDSIYLAYPVCQSLVLRQGYHILILQLLQLFIAIGHTRWEAVRKTGDVFLDLGAGALILRIRRRRLGTVGLLLRHLLRLHRGLRLRGLCRLRRRLLSVAGLGCRLSLGVLLALVSLLVLILSLILVLVLVLLVLLLLLLLRTKQLFLLYELRRPLLQLRFRLVVLWRTCRLSLVDLPEVYEDYSIFLLLVFGEASELEDVIWLEELGLLLLRWRALGPLGLGVAHGPGRSGD